MCASLPDPRPGTLPLADTALGALGIEIVEAAADRVVMTMQVDTRHAGLHGSMLGGAAVVLAESVASTGAGLAALPDGRAFGVEIDASHLRPVRGGTLTAIGVPLHQGRTTQVWSVDIRDEAGEPVCRSRCTLAVRSLSSL